MIWGIAAAILATLALTILVLNLSSGERSIDHRVEHLYSVGDPEFSRSMGNLLGPPLLPGNSVVELLNGDQIFPSMLEAIRGAKRSITFETYIYWSGNVGEQFTEALSERARAGVKVHILIDWAGSGRIDDEYLERMERAGAQVERYHPLAWYTLARLNHRTHRRLLVVDGRVGFTGGVGIGDEWLGNAQDQDHWRESHFRLEGPAVAQMQAAFLDNWLKTHSEVLHGEDYFPELRPAGDMAAQVFKSSSREGSESARMMYLLSIAAARETILISASYFVPDDLTVSTLVEARRRGVAVRVILPGPVMDVEVSRKASRGRWGDLLSAGVEIYEYQPTMYHCKVMIVDGIWVSAGSTNFDNRSFRLNDEANLNVLDRGFAGQLTETFERDRAKARRITLQEWLRRPWKERVLEKGAALFRSQI
ncbi:MAG: phospholipase D-like domain-containing protein [Thermoanaerobaculia bacterium]